MTEDRRFLYVKPTAFANGTPFNVNWILPAGQFFRVVAVTFNLNDAAGGGFQVEVNCSKNGDIYWQATMPTNLVVAAFNGGVCFARQSEPVIVSVGASRIQHPLPDVWVPGESIVIASELTAVDPITIGLPLMVLETREFGGLT